MWMVASSCPPLPRSSLPLRQRLCHRPPSRARIHPVEASTAECLVSSPRAKYPSVLSETPRAAPVRDIRQVRACPRSVRHGRSHKLPVRGI